MNVQECWNVQHTGPSTLFENSEGTIQLMGNRYRICIFAIQAIYASEVQVTK